MDILQLLLALTVLGAIFYLIHKLQNLHKPADESSQKLMLEMIENLRKSVMDGDEKSQKNMQERFDKITESLNQQHHRSFETIQKQFGQSAKIISDVTKKLTKLDETNKQVVGFAKQMQSLEDILKNPKHRGILGEYFFGVNVECRISPRHL